MALSWNPILKKNGVPTKLDFYKDLRKLFSSSIPCSCKPSSPLCNAAGEKHIYILLSFPFPCHKQNSSDGSSTLLLDLPKCSRRTAIRYEFGRRCQVVDWTDVDSLYTSYVDKNPEFSYLTESLANVQGRFSLGANIPFCVCIFVVVTYSIARMGGNAKTWLVK